MNTSVVLVVVLVIYAAVGAAFAFNVRGVSDRAADSYRGKPWFIRQIGRDNPNTWRGGGAFMLIFGAALIFGLALLSVWHPAQVSTELVAILLGAAAAGSLVMLVRERLRQSRLTNAGRKRRSP